jgi:hypothetical protein
MASCGGNGGSTEHTLSQHSTTQQQQQTVKPKEIDNCALYAHEPFLEERRTHNTRMGGMGYSGLGLCTPMVEFGVSQSVKLGNFNKSAIQKHA